jgi:hypothetical protein
LLTSAISLNEGQLTDTRLTCLMIRLKPSVRAFDTRSVKATRIAGHQVWTVPVSRVASGNWASIAAS